MDGWMAKQSEELNREGLSIFRSLELVERKVTGRHTGATSRGDRHGAVRRSFWQ